MKLPCEHSRLDLIIAGTEDLELWFIIWDLCEMKKSKQLHTSFMDAEYPYLFLTAM